MHFRILGLLGVCCLSLATPCAVGEIYKWVDNQGTTHYADRPSVDGRAVERKTGQLPRLNIGQPTPQMAPIKTRSSRVRPRPARKPDSRKDCGRYRAAISKLEHSLRQGYVEPAGTRLRERKRHWSALLHRHCY